MAQNEPWGIANTQSNKLTDNDGKSTLSYPASYDAVMAVGAVDTWHIGIYGYYAASGVNLEVTYKPESYRCFLALL